MRSFFWAAFVPAATLLTIEGGCSQSTRRGMADRSAIPTLPAAFRDLGRQYGLRVEVLARPVRNATSKGSAPSGHEYDPPTAEEVTSHAGIVLDELTRYPPEFIRRLQLRDIVLCGGMISDGRPISGLAGGKVYLSLRIDPHQAAREANWARHAFHHELYHLLDARNGKKFDASWDALNPPGFHYGDTSSTRASYRRQPPAGFLFDDSCSARNEDQAHFFGAMMTQYAAVRDLAGRDPVVRAKADLMEAMVADFDPGLGSEFWKEALRRTEAPERRVLAALWYSWSSVKAGVDPLAVEVDPTARRVIVRRTRLPDVSAFRMDEGRMTQLDVPAGRLISFLYGRSPARCIMPDDLKNERFDVIVWLPNAARPTRDAVLSAVREAFEVQAGVTVRHEVRPCDVYVLRLGATGTRQLDELAEKARQNPAANAPHTRPAGSTWAPWRERSEDLLRPRSARPMYLRARRMMLSEIAGRLEHGELDRPLLDETGFARPISVDAVLDPSDPSRRRQQVEQALGIELVPDRRPIEITVLERVWDPNVRGVGMEASQKPSPTTGS